MTERTTRIRVIFPKICTFCENNDFMKKKLGKKLTFLLAIFKAESDINVFDGSIGCATEFHSDHFLYFFLSHQKVSSLIKSYSVFFVQNLQKFNILSVITID